MPGGFGDDERYDPIGELLLGLGLSEDGRPKAQDPQAAAAMRQVRTLLAPFVLRRLKSQATPAPFVQTTTTNINKQKKYLDMK